MKSEWYPPRRSFFPGRWQPLHHGHIRLIREALNTGRSVVVGIMVTPLSERNPYTVDQRRHMFWRAFHSELVDGRMQLLEMPWMDEVCYGRDCGWRARRINLPENVEAISGTALRAEATQHGEG